VSAPLLEIRGLRVAFHGRHGVARAVDGIDLELRAGETLALVGESGSGKTVTALSILRLLEPPWRIEAGQILFRGRDLLALPEREVRAVRGNEIAMVFQDPLSALDPVLTIEAQVAEGLRAHRVLSRESLRVRVRELLRMVQLPDPERCAKSFPHQLSGGMRQRALIALAMACEPALVLADEPTSSLDVTVQAGILDLLRELARTRGTAFLLITHDLGVVAEVADRVAVIYAGRIVEEASAAELFERPRHPYTLGLLASRPALVRPAERLRPIPGAIPSPTELPTGCRFRTRCGIARPECAELDPELRPIAGDPRHFVACPFAEGAEVPA
jgi:peptide/nickel transport system ATP-binding protein